MTQKYELCNIFRATHQSLNATTRPVLSRQHKEHKPILSPTLKETTTRLLHLGKHRNWWNPPPRNSNNLPTIWYEFDGMRSHPRPYTYIYLSDPISTNRLQTIGRVTPTSAMSNDTWSIRRHRNRPLWRHKRTSTHHQRQLKTITTRSKTIVHQNTNVPCILAKPVANRSHKMEASTGMYRPIT